MYVEITLYFTDNKRLIAGQLPYEVAVKRFVPTSKNILNAVLDEFFKGPGDVERNQGLAMINNGFTGYKKVESANGGVYVYLAGSCQSNGTLYNITRPLLATLKNSRRSSSSRSMTSLGIHGNPRRAWTLSLPVWIRLLRRA